jgi:hypothetical protein
MGRGLAIAALALVGLLCAAGMGAAAYVVSRSSVAVPVTKLQQVPAQKLTPATLKAKRAEPQPTTSTAEPPPPTTTGDDHGGDHHGGGGGGGGHGGDDD